MASHGPNLVDHQLHQPHNRFTLITDLQLCTPTLTTFLRRVLRLMYFTGAPDIINTKHMGSTEYFRQNSIQKSCIVNSLYRRGIPPPSRKRSLPNTSIHSVSDCVMEWTRSSRVVPTYSSGLASLRRDLRRSPSPMPWQLYHSAGQPA